MIQSLYSQGRGADHPSRSPAAASPSGPDLGICQPHGYKCLISSADIPRCHPSISLLIMFNPEQADPWGRHGVDSHTHRANKGLQEETWLVARSYFYMLGL